MKPLNLQARRKQTPLFITGTDTGVGKTTVALQLALQWQASYWKPIQTGTPSDTEKAISILGPKKVFLPTYSLKAPLAPEFAARLEDVEIQLACILKQFALLRSKNCIIEGIGGLLVPLYPGTFLIDLIQALHLPTLLVARSTIGTLNHTFLSLESLRKRKIQVPGVILVGPPHPENKQAIETYAKTKVLAEIP